MEKTTKKTVPRVQDPVNWKSCYVEKPDPNLDPDTRPPSALVFALLHRPPTQIGRLYDLGVLFLLERRGLLQRRARALTTSISWPIYSSSSCTPDGLQQTSEQAELIDAELNAIET